MSPSPSTTPTTLKVRGAWPERVQLSSGWARATVRPWNDDLDAAVLRLERGSSRFLRAASARVLDWTRPVLSPALLPSRTSVWSEAGYKVADRLMLFEHDLRQVDPPLLRVERGWLEPVEELHRIDQAAFSERWRLGIVGLRESLEATTRTVVHRVHDDGSAVAFAITGLSLGQGYLQRLAVHPRVQGRGYGTALLRASLRWARANGARAVLINTQTENRRASRLYGRLGFVPVPGGLVVMSLGADGPD